MPTTPLPRLAWMSAGSDPVVDRTRAGALDEGLQRRLAVAVLPGVCALGVVTLHPGVDVLLQLVQRMGQLTAERARVKLVVDGLVEALADAVGLRTLRPGARVLDVLEIEIQRRLACR